MFGNLRRGSASKGVGVGERFGCLTCNAGVSCKMLSQMCDSWHFPKFLFSNGSFTLMNIASVMFL